MEKQRKLTNHSLFKRNLKSFLFFFAGLAALTWFLVRVIPKPSRAAYPCQQAAFPFASAFVIWLSGILTSTFIFTRAKAKWRRSKYIIAFALFFLAMAVFMVTSTSVKYTPVMARAYFITASLLGNAFPSMHDFTKSDSLLVEPAARVAIVKSSEAYAADIEFEEIVSMVTEAIDLAGGLDGIISDGDTVIIKPNIVSYVDGTANPQQLDSLVNGITTDYRVVQAVVNIVREINPAGQVYVLDGSAYGNTAVNFVILRYDHITGIDSLVSLEDVSGAVGDTNSIHLQGVSLPPGRALYQGANNRYWMHKLYYNADVVISVPVLKNHGYTGATGSVKNVGIGATPSNIYGHVPGWTPNMRLRIDHESFPPTNLHYWIHDYFMCRPVDFVVVDGLQSIENGPASTETTQYLFQDQMNMRLILAGKDPIAVDAINTLLTGHDPELIPHLVTLHNDTLGCCDARLIRVSGKKVGDEKKIFETYHAGVFSLYDDFDPPSFTIDECYIDGDQLHCSLTVDEEVTKVEVAIDGIYLDQIVIGGFNDFTLDLDTSLISPGMQAYVYAYDKYLNYSSEYALTVSSDPPGEISTGQVFPLILEPNPSSVTTRLRFTIPARTAEPNLPGGYDKRIVIGDLLGIDGKKIKRLLNEEMMAGTYEIKINLDDIPEGIYMIRVQAGDVIFTGKLVKINN